MLARSLRIVKICARVTDKGLYPLTVCLYPRPELVHGDGLGSVDVHDREVFPLKQIGKLRLEVLGVHEVARHDGLFLIFIGVKRGYALLGRAVLLVREALFLKLVKHSVPRQEQGRSVAYHEVFRRYENALGRKIVYLAAKVLAVERNAVAEHIHNALAEHARRQQMQCKLAELVYDGVACVAAALKSHDDIIFFREQVDHAALALVAPVDAYNCTV